MRQLQNSTVATTILSLALTAFALPSIAANSAGTQSIQPSASQAPSALTGEYQLAQGQIPDSCRQVSAQGVLGIRQQPSSESPVVGNLANNQRVVIQNRGNNGWVPILSPVEGYIPAANLVYCTSAAPAPPPATSDNCRQVRARGGLNVRQEPSTTSAIVGRFANRQRIVVESRGNNGWVPVASPVQGYVYAPYLGYCF